LGIRVIAAFLVNMYGLEELASLVCWVWLACQLPDAAEESSPSSYGVAGFFVFLFAVPFFG
jgi:hypothetical protein